MDSVLLFVCVPVFNGDFQNGKQTMVTYRGIYIKKLCSCGNKSQLVREKNPHPSKKKLCLCANKCIFRKKIWSSNVQDKTKQSAALLVVCMNVARRACKAAPGGKTCFLSALRVEIKAFLFVLLRLFGCCASIKRFFAGCRLLTCVSRQSRN